MTSPLKSLLNTLRDISICLTEAYNNRCSPTEINEIKNLYNQYYFAVQLIGSHYDVPVKFTRLVNSNNGKLRYKESELDYHLHGVDRINAFKSEAMKIHKEVLELEKAS